MTSFKLQKKLSIDVLVKIKMVGLPVWSDDTLRGGSLLNGVLRVNIIFFVWGERLKIINANPIWIEIKWLRFFFIFDQLDEGRIYTINVTLLEGWLREYSLFRHSSVLQQGPLNLSPPVICDLLISKTVIRDFALVPLNLCIKVIQ